MKNHLNLIPWEFRRRQLVRRRLGQWSAVWGLVVLGAFVIGWGKMRACQKTEQTLLARQRSFAPLELVLAETGQMQLRLEEFEARNARLGPFTYRQPPLSLLGVVSRSAGPADRKVWVRSLQLQRVNRAGPGPAKEPANGEAMMNSRLTLDGIGWDSLEVAKFVANLRGSGMFAKVELRSSNQNPAGRNAGHAYSVQCWY